MPDKTGDEGRFLPVSRELLQPLPPGARTANTPDSTTTNIGLPRWMLKYLEYGFDAEIAWAVSSWILTTRTT